MERIKQRKHMNHAKFIAENYSKDASTKVGCIIIGSGNNVLSTGYNGIPRGLDDNIEERHVRPEKYKWFEHAERNAIFNAARNGIKLEGSHMYCTSLVTCIECARAIIQSGILMLFLELSAFADTNERGQVWMDQWAISKEMLDEAGVRVFAVHDENANYMERIYSDSLLPPSMRNEVVQLSSLPQLQEEVRDVGMDAAWRDVLSI